MTRMRIAVIGAGAVGSTLGALLTMAGYRCVLVARPAHCAAIRATGLRLTGCLGNITVDMEAVSRLRPTADLALVTTKVHDVRAAVEMNREALAGVPRNQPRAPGSDSANRNDSLVAGAGVGASVNALSMRVIGRYAKVNFPKT